MYSGDGAGGSAKGPARRRRLRFVGEVRLIPPHYARATGNAYSVAPEVGAVSAAAASGAGARTESARGEQLPRVSRCAAGPDARGASSAGGERNHRAAGAAHQPRRVHGDVSAQSARVRV